MVEGSSFVGSPPTRTGSYRCFLRLHQIKRAPSIASTTIGITTAIAIFAEVDKPELDGPDVADVVEVFEDLVAVPVPDFEAGVEEEVMRSVL